jgi:DNA-binding transcriptional LysR family regulator
MGTMASLKHMRAFLSVAQAGSFTRAANLLHLTQSSVTALVAQLEDSLEVRLFSRNSRNVELTAAGADLLPRARRLVGDFDGLIDDMRRYGTLEKGIVRVYSALSAMEYLVTPAIAAFAKLYPSIRIQLQDGMYRPIIEAVLAGTVDFGITSHWSDTPGLTFTPLVKDAYGMFLRADDELANSGEQATWSNLTDRNIVDYNSLTGNTTFLRWHSEMPASVLSPFYEVSSSGAQEALVKQGIGVAILPALAAHCLLTPATRFVVLQNPLIERDLCLITRCDHELSPAAAALSKLVRDCSARMANIYGVRRAAPVL